MRYLVAIGVLSAVVFARGAAGATTAAAPAATPQEAMVKLFTAVRDGDEAAALRVTKDDPAGRELVKALVAFGAASNEFERAFVKAYGAEAWAQFNDEKRQPPARPGETGNANARIMAVDDNMLGELGKAEPKMEGDVAVVAVPNSGQPARVEKVEGGWVVDAASMAPPQAKPEQMARLMTDLAEIVRAHRPAVGATGITADDIDVELGRVFAEKLLGVQSKDPHRYDLTKLPATRPATGEG